MHGAKKLDLVLINPASRRQVYQSLGSKLSAVENPVWAGMMAGFCLQHGLSVEIIDAEAEELSPAQVTQRVEELSPRLTAVVVYGHQPSASTQVMTAAGDLCTTIRERQPEQKILMLGGHVAALPRRTLMEEDVDFVAGGEGLHTLVELVEAVRGNCSDFSAVSGLWYRENGEVRSSPGRPLVRDLDRQLPGIPWDRLPMHRYRAHNWHCLGGLRRQPYAAIYTSLGCPYHCSFCCIQAPFKSGERAAGLKAEVNSYRCWSPAAVLKQIDLLVQRHGVRNLKIADEMFVLNPRHVLGICEGLIERDYDLNIWAYTRIDTIKPGMLEKLRAAGFRWLAIGIEAGADRVRDNVDKAFAREDIVRVIARVRDAGIHVIGNYIFGLPEDDLETMQATLDLAIDLNCEFANFYSAMAYPGSPLYAQAVRQGVPLPRTWAGFSQHARECLPLPTRYLPAREVLRFRDEAFLRYYTGSRYLQMMQQRFGSAAVTEIAQMMACRLERDLLTGKLRVPDTLLAPTDEPTGTHVNRPLYTVQPRQVNLA